MIRFLITLTLTSLSQATPFLGQGVMSGELSDHSISLQTRLTATAELNESGDLPGTEGVVAFEWSLNKDFTPSSTTPFKKALPEQDFIVRTRLTQLQPHSTYYYRAHYGTSKEKVQASPICSFKTLPGENKTHSVRFIIGSCMNYNKFLHGRKANARGPITATPEDKELGFPAFTAMAAQKPDFFIGTGDIVYYDNRFRNAESLPELRKCWHEQFRFPRMIGFFQNVPTYWSKDDHDFRYNDSDNTTDRLPLSQTGIDLFREQLPLPEKSYRTIRVTKDLQIWLTEGRDYRSANHLPDGPDKTLWGDTQKSWLQRTLKTSDAKWKILISPTPLVGPDDASKKDNHTNLRGFRHEADSFFNWLSENQIENLITVCGDRHWQYHSIHPSGIHEFACGALNDENARLGRKPGDKKSTDPKALITQPFLSPKPSGGFLLITADEHLSIEFRDDSGEILYQTQR